MQRIQSNVQAMIAAGADRTDRALERLLPSPDTLPHSIHRAMRHSTFAGGKRLRPVLAIEAARLTYGSSYAASEHPARDPHQQAENAPEQNQGDLCPEGIEDLAAALEMLHTYSLIHDDLPALDNDELRRGQPTCHVVFGEATAILAGDALQTLAFQTLSALPLPPAAAIAILREISAAVSTGIGHSGDLDTGLPPGMIGGQVVDLESEHQLPTASLVETIHRAKTGALITTSIVSGGLYGAALRSDSGLLHVPAFGASEDVIRRLRTFGQNAGLAFQIVDDVLDVTQESAQLGKTAGKDTASLKATWPAVFGIEQSLADANQLIADAFQALEPFGEAAQPLRDLALYLVERNH